MKKKHIVKDKHNCVYCGSAVKHDKVLCIMVTDFHCLLSSCGYKDMRVIEHPAYDPEVVEEAMEYIRKDAAGIVRSEDRRLIYAKEIVSKID